MINKIITAIRSFYYSLIFKIPLSYLRVYGNFTIISADNFSTLPGLRINHYCYIDAKGGVELGHNVTLSAGAMILSSGIATDEFVKIDRVRDYHTYSKVIINDNVWVGAGAKIMPGVHLTGSNVIVAAGAVVTKSFNNSNVILAGVPAVVIKNIKSSSI
jgi:acetyltransferase-like isoleucine patch superfamily enzyme